MCTLISVNICICNMEIDKLLSFENFFETMDDLSNLC